MKTRFFIVSAILILVQSTLMFKITHAEGAVVSNWGVIDQIPTDILKASAIGLNNDENLIYIVGRGGDIEVRDTQTFEIAASTHLPVATTTDSLGAPAIVPDGSAIIVGDEHGDLYFLDPFTLETLQVFDYGHRDGPYAQIDVTSDSTKAVTSSIITSNSIYHGNIYFYDLTKNPVEQSGTLTVYGNPWRVELTPDNTQAYVVIDKNVVGIGYIVRVVDMSTHQEVAQIHTSERLRDIVMDPIRNRAYIAHPTLGGLVVIDIETSQEIAVHQVGSLSYIAYNAEADILVGTSGNVLKFISPNTGKILQELQLQVDNVVFPEFTADGSRLYVTAVTDDAWSVIVLEAGPQEIAIDIKPGSDPNSINLRSKGTVPVAIFTTDEFDVFSADIASIRFADASVEKSSFRDIDSDGDDDLILHFKTQELNLDETSLDAKVVGLTSEGIVFEGIDLVNIVPR